MSIEIPCWLMRGGTSKGPFFRAADLPAELAARDRVLLSIMGSPDLRQIDGLGGATPLTSKLGILSVPTDGQADLDFLFAQVGIGEAKIDTTPNCGNMLAAAAPAALEAGLLEARGERTTLRVRTRNTGVIAEITIDTPNGRPAYAGEARIDGVPGTAAPVRIGFLDTEGSLCGSLLPSGQLRDRLEGGIDATLIDNGMPVMIVAAAALGLSGYETREALNADATLKARLEALRREAGVLMGLGDVGAKLVPKITLVAPPRAGGTLCTRTFIPHDCHAAIGVLGAVTVATAAVLPGSVAHQAAAPVAGEEPTLSIEHPSGEFSVALSLTGGRVARAALLRTARLLMRGHAPVPASVWSGA